MHIDHRSVSTYTGPYSPAVWEVWLFSTGLPLEVVKTFLDMFKYKREGGGDLAKKCFLLERRKKKEKQKREKKIRKTKE